MAKLKALGSALGRLPSSLAYMPQTEQEYDRFRGRQSWRKLYNTTRWRKLRLSIFQRDGFMCVRCRKVEASTSNLVCDHIERHSGDERLFWDESNLATMCKHCHDSAKQSEERRGGAA